MPNEQQRSYLFVAIDRATRWVFMRIYADQTECSAVDFLRRVHEAAVFKITQLLTDNGTQFTDRFNGRISEVVKQTRFASAGELAAL
jgi:IS30 family transposase